MLVVASLAFGAEDPAGTATLVVRPTEATVGDRIEAALTVELPAGTVLQPPDLGSTLGPFEIVAGSWGAPVEEGGRRRTTWGGTLVKFETGVFEIPSLSIAVPGAQGGAVLHTEPVSVTLKSVLPPESTPTTGEEPDLADLKAPASVKPNFRPLRLALAALALLLVASAIAWWLHRRFAARLAAAAVPQDPFHRVAPHEWAYGELQLLLERRLPEQGEVVLFFAEISRILKRYLGGRYRVELMERTTEEFVPLLRQAAAPVGPIADARALLEQCDLVKFARLTPPPDACRKVVEQAYRVVDLTRPVQDAPVQAREAGVA